MYPEVHTAKLLQNKVLHAMYLWVHIAIFREYYELVFARVSAFMDVSYICKKVIYDLAQVF